jgi:hypothetical protein
MHFVQNTYDPKPNHLHNDTGLFVQNYLCYLLPVATGQGHVVAQLVEALRYKPEHCRFDSRWCHWNFSLT